jgi:hypothetical protein
MTFFILRESNDWASYMQNFKYLLKYSQITTSGIIYYLI